MSHVTIILDTATEARLRQAAEETGRGCEELAELAVAEAAHAYFSRRADDPARNIGVLHPLLLPAEVYA